MGFELPDGKTARNLQEQVAFLTAKLKELIAFVNQAGLKSIQIVEELPEVGDPSILYLLQKEDPNEGDYYDEYLWIDEAWELIGTTRIDLSDYCTLSTDQTITGTKTIKENVLFLTPTEANNWTIFTNGEYYLTIQRNSNNYFSLGGECIFYVPITPSGSKDIGKDTARWKDLYLSGKAYVGNLSIYTLSNGENVIEDTVNYNDIQLGVGLIPKVNNAKDLGGSSNYWNNGYISEIYVNKLIAKTGGQIRPVSSLVPQGSSLDLGKSDNRWSNIYLSGNVSDGTNSSTVENLVKKARLYKHKITTSGGNVINVITPTASAFTDFNPAMIDDCIIAKVGSSTILSYNYGGGQMSDLYYVNYTGTQTTLSLTGQTITTDEISDI